MVEYYRSGAHSHSFPGEMRKIGSGRNYLIPLISDDCSLIGSDQRIPTISYSRPTDSDNRNRLFTVVRIPSIPEVGTRRFLSGSKRFWTGIPIIPLRRTNTVDMKTLRDVDNCDQASPKITISFQYDPHRDNIHHQPYFSRFSCWSSSFSSSISPLNRSITTMAPTTKATTATKTATTWIIATPTTTTTTINSPRQRW